MGAAGRDARHLVYLHAQGRRRPVGRVVREAARAARAPGPDRAVGVHGHGVVLAERHLHAPVEGRLDGPVAVVAVAQAELAAAVAAPGPQRAPAVDRRRRSPARRDLGDARAAAEADAARRRGVAAAAEAARRRNAPRRGPARAVEEQRVVVARRAGDGRHATHGRGRRRPVADGTPRVDAAVRADHHHKGRAARDLHDAIDGRKGGLSHQRDLRLGYAALLPFVRAPAGDAAVDERGGGEAPARRHAQGLDAQRDFHGRDGLILRSHALAAVPHAAAVVDDDGVEGRRRGVAQRSGSGELGRRARDADAVGLGAALAVRRPAPPVEALLLPLGPEHGHFGGPTTRRLKISLPVPVFSTGLTPSHCSQLAQRHL